MSCAINFVIEILTHTMTMGRHSCLTIDLTRDNGVSKILTCSASSLFSSAYTATAPYHWMKEISHSVLIPVLSILATRTICFNVVLRIVYWWTRSVSTSGTFFSYFLENPYSQRRRGNHETGGTWKQGALEEDLEDLNAVVAYLKSKYSYEIELVVGHSRGSLVGFRWISTTETGRKVPAFINVSGRYRMRVSISRHVKARYSAMLRKCHSLTIFVSTSPFVVSWVAMGDNHPTLQFRQILIEQLHLCLSRKKILGNDRPSCASSVLFFQSRCWLSCSLVGFSYPLTHFRRSRLFAWFPTASSPLPFNLGFSVASLIVPWRVITTSISTYIALPNGSIPESAGAQRWSESFTKQGYYEWHVTVARKPIVAMIYPHDVEKFCAWDTSIIWAQFPKETDVLTLHGLADKTVPPWVSLPSFNLHVF